MILACSPQWSTTGKPESADCVCVCASVALFCFFWPQRVSQWAVTLHLPPQCRRGPSRKRRVATMLRSHHLGHHPTKAEIWRREVVKRRIMPVCVFQSVLSMACAQLLQMLGCQPDIRQNSVWQTPLSEFSITVWDHVLPPILIAFCYDTDFAHWLLTRARVRIDGFAF